ncbi:MAG: cupin domain-containing protein [Polyangiales bacterium]
MTGHVDEKLAELALEVLPAEERALVELHLQSCPRCVRELHELREAVTSLASLAVSAPPSGEVRRRLFADVVGRARYAPFADRVARFFGIDVADAERALESITETTAWRPGPMPGMSMAKVPSRAKVPRQTAIFLRSDAGAVCPDHRHIGEERLLILEGGIIESDGTELHAGDLVVKPAGSSHAFRVPEEEACIAAYILDEGMELLA